MADEKQENMEKTSSCPESESTDDMYFQQVITVNYEELVQEMKASHVLICMSTLHAYAKEITDEGKGIEANKKLIALMLEHKCKGWFQMFIHALKSTGHNRLARRLGMRDVKDDEFGRQLVNIFLPSLCHMDVIEVLPELVATGVIGRFDRKEIQSKQGTEAFWHLIFSLEKQRDDWFVHFLMALKKTKNRIAGEMLSCVEIASSHSSLAELVDQTRRANSGQYDCASDPKKLKKMDEEDEIGEHYEAYAVSREPSLNCDAVNLQSAAEEKSCEKQLNLNSPASPPVVGAINQGIATIFIAGTQSARTPSSVQRVSQSREPQHAAQPRAGSQEVVASVSREPMAGNSVSGGQAEPVTASNGSPQRTSTGSSAQISSPSRGQQPTRSAPATELKTAYDTNYATSNARNSLFAGLGMAVDGGNSSADHAGPMRNNRGNVHDSEQFELDLRGPSLQDSSDVNSNQGEYNLSADDVAAPVMNAFNTPNQLGTAASCSNNLSSPQNDLSLEMRRMKADAAANAESAENRPMVRSSTTGAARADDGGFEYLSDTVFISGLPLDVTVRQIHDHFSMSGDIPVSCDGQGRRCISLLKDTATGGPNGTATVKFLTDELAGSVIEMFNNTEFLGESVHVELAWKPRDTRRESRPNVVPASASSSVLYARESSSASRVASSSASRSLSESSRSIREALGEESRCPEEPQELCLRSYQTELASKAIEGKNCIIVAPTGSGKTHVALEITNQHFLPTAYGDAPRKVAFFVPTVALVDQQRRQFERFLSSQKTLGISGDQDAKLPFGDILPLYNIIVMTPQILENALKNKDIESLSIFSLMIFDECHHTTKGHTYNVIMSHYIDELFEFEEDRRLLGEDSIRAASGLPQIVGLTASVGVGKAKSKDQAVDHILKLCANLHAEHICTVKKNVTELRQHVNKPSEMTTEIHGRTSDPFNDGVQRIMKEIESRMKSSNTIVEVEADNMNFRGFLQAPGQDRGSDRYTQWIHKLDKPVASIYRQDTRRFYVACLKHLMIYNAALLINADCRTKDAVEYLERAMNPAMINDISSFSDETDIWLQNLFESKKEEFAAVSRDSRYENPKLNHLKDIILGYYREKPDSRGIIFCKTRDLTVALMNWMKATPELKALNPHNLVGANAPSNRAGMTQFQQEDVLKYFKDGHHKLIIATSVAEEGLDVQKCNIVIRYEHVTNSISRVQSRGRARAEEAQFVLVAQKGRGMADKEEFNKIREKLMQTAIDIIDDMPSPEIRRKVKGFQKEAKVERDMANHGKRISSMLKKSQFLEGPYELRCHKCDSFSARSEDIRKIEDSHHVMIDEDYKQRVKIRPHPAPKKFANFELTGKIYCLRCHEDWGIMGVYKKVSFPVIKICSFVVINSRGERNKYNRWKEVPFTVKVLEPDDLENKMRAMIERNEQSDRGLFDGTASLEGGDFDLSFFD